MEKESSQYRRSVCVYLCSVDQLPLSIISLFKKLQEWIRLPKHILHRQNMFNFKKGNVDILIKPLRRRRKTHGNKEGRWQGAVELSYLLVKVFSCHFQFNGSVVLNLLCCDLNINTEPLFDMHNNLKFVTTTDSQIQRNTFFVFIITSW